MSGDKVIADAMYGTLDWTLDKIKSVVNQITSRDLIFIQDNETIDTAKEQRNTGEFAIYSPYIKKNDYRILFQLGLTLRKIEEDVKKRENLRSKIYNKYDEKGLHIAELVQNAILNKYLGNMLERANTPKKITFEIGNLFDNIEKFTSFIQTGAMPLDKKANEVSSKIQSFSPKTFILSSREGAMENCRAIKERVEKIILGYNIESVGSKKRKIYFFNKDDII